MWIFCIHDCVSTFPSTGTRSAQFGTASSRRSSSSPYSKDSSTPDAEDLCILSAIQGKLTTPVPRFNVSGALSSSLARRCVRRRQLQQEACADREKNLTTFSTRWQPLISYSKALLSPETLSGDHLRVEKKRFKTIKIPAMFIKKELTRKRSQRINIRILALRSAFYSNS